MAIVTPTNKAIVASDMDGTFISGHKQLRPDTIETYRAVFAAGHEVVPATGRCYSSIKRAVQTIAPEFYEEMRFCPGVYSHGAIAFGDSESEILYEKYLDTELLKNTIEAVYKIRDSKGIDPRTGYCTVAISTATETIIDYESELYLTRIVKGFEEWHSVSLDRDLTPEDLQNVKVTHLSIFGMGNLLSDFRLNFDERGSIEGVRYMCPFDEQLVFISSDVNKGYGLEVLCKHYGWDPSHIIALGDGENDVEMLKWAGTGVAMGNASEHVKKYADLITSNVNEGGWSKAIEARLFDTPSPQSCATRDISA